MAKSFHLTIAKVGNNLFEGEAVAVTVPGSKGQLTVMANHEALVTPLKQGLITVESADGTEHSIELIDQGILEVSQNQATIIL